MKPTLRLDARVGGFAELPLDTSGPLTRTGEDNAIISEPSRDTIRRDGERGSARRRSRWLRACVRVAHRHRRPEFNEDMVALRGRSPPSRPRRRAAPARRRGAAGFGSRPARYADCGRNIISPNHMRGTQARPAAARKATRRSPEQVLPAPSSRERTTPRHSNSAACCAGIRGADEGYDAIITLSASTCRADRRPEPIPRPMSAGRIPVNSVPARRDRGANRLTRPAAASPMPIAGAGLCGADGLAFGKTIARRPDSPKPSGCRESAEARSPELVSVKGSDWEAGLPWRLPPDAECGIPALRHNGRNWNAGFRRLILQVGYRRLSYTN